MWIRIARAPLPFPIGAKIGQINVNTSLTLPLAVGLSDFHGQLVLNNLG
jgi:hypothetical protein